MMGFQNVKQTSFLTDFLRQCGGHAIIDGGLATELERHGADLNDPLWSAKCLVSSTELIRRVTSPSLYFLYAEDFSRSDM